MHSGVVGEGKIVFIALSHGDFPQVNHFPGTFQIGRKDRLWKNLSRMQLRVGKKVCIFSDATVKCIYMYV